MRLKTIYCIISILMIGQALNAQSLHLLIEYPYQIIESKWETHPTDKTKTQLNYYNNDYCPYYMFRINEKEAYSIKPGKTSLITKDKNDKMHKALGPGYYRYYRGMFLKSFNPAFVYAMPVKDGKNVMCTQDLSERVKTITFKSNYRDTVYASRTGRACNTDFNRGVLLYHEDGTFAAYLNLEEKFISPGDVARTGEPIGISGFGGVSLSVFFLDENLFKFGETKVYPYTHFNPYFRTDKGDVRLEMNTEYKAVVDDDVITSEMSKSQKKRYLKKKK